MSNKKSFAVVLFLLALFVTAVTAKRFTKTGSPVLENPSAGDTTKASSQNRRSDLIALVFTVRPIGFDPEEVEISAGRALIVVQNRSGRRDLSFRLQRENGEGLHSVEHDRLDWKHQLDLHPGTYVLSEDEHPEWRCRIRVTAQ